MRKILIIEDDSFLQKALTKATNIEKMEVISAVDGESGLRMAKDEEPDLILLDILLPKMDGFGVLQKLKNDSTTAKIPVIILSNLGQTDDVQKGLDSGADDYLIKAHFSLDEIMSKINKILAKNK